MASDLEPRDILNEQTRGCRPTQDESGQHIFDQVQEGLRAGICGPFGPWVEHRVRLARWGQEPEVRVERLDRIRIQRADIDLSRLLSKIADGSGKSCARMRTLRAMPGP